jgi:hypothetical protein
MGWGIHSALLLMRTALDHHGKAEASGDAHMRGLLVVQTDGTAAYDVCTAWSGGGGKTVCADQIHFTVDIFDWPENSVSGEPVGSRQLVRRTELNLSLELLPT